MFVCIFVARGEGGCGRCESCGSGTNCRLYSNYQSITFSPSSFMYRVRFSIRVITIRSQDRRFFTTSDRALTFFSFLYSSHKGRQVCWSPLVRLAYDSECVCTGWTSRILLTTLLTRCAKNLRPDDNSRCRLPVLPYAS